MAALQDGSPWKALTYISLAAYRQLQQKFPKSRHLLRNISLSHDMSDVQPWTSSARAARASRAISGHACHAKRRLLWASATPAMPKWWMSLLRNKVEWINCNLKACWHKENQPNCREPNAPQPCLSYAHGLGTVPVHKANAADVTRQRHPCVTRQRFLGHRPTHGHLALTHGENWTQRKVKENFSNSLKRQVSVLDMTTRNSAKHELISS